MAVTASTFFGKPRAAGDNMLFLRVRWLLGLWIAVTVVLHWGLGWADWAGVGVILGFLVSQLALWRLKAGVLKGLQLHTAVFILDLLLTILALAFTGQARPVLLAVLFLSIFITALVGRMTLSLLVSGVSVLVYLLLRVQGPGGADFSDVRQLLDLPFIVLSSMHASIVVSEAQFRQDISESMDEDNQTLSKKLGSAAAELKARVRFINGAFDAVPAATVVVDGEGFLRSFNTRAEELFGAKRQPLLDKPIQGQPFLEPLRVAMRALNGEGDAAVWLKRLKGGWFYAGLRCGIARDGDGRLSNMVVFVQELEPPAETPTYEAWQKARQAQIQDYTQGRKSAPTAPGSPSEGREGEPAAPAAPPPAKGPGQPRSALVREIADTVERDHPAERQQ